MSAERALLRRLVEWVDHRELFDTERPLQEFARDARALLAEPEGGVGATYEGRPWRDVFPLPETVQTVASTPRSRAEGSDLSVDQGREFRVVDGLGDNNRAGKVTIDPTLLSPPTPLSRAGAEAMVDAALRAAVHWEDGDIEDDVFDAHRAALLAALTGEGK